MRIAFVAPFGLRAKGTTRGRVLPLARALTSLGHEVSVWIPPYDSPEDSGRSWHDAGLHVHNFALSRHAGAWRMLDLVRQIVGAVRSWDPAVIHAFKPKGPSGLAATLLQLGRARAAAPVLVDTDDWEGPGGWNDDPRLGYGQIARLFFAWQERYGLAHAAGWTVASACLRDRAIAFGATPGAISVVPNGVLTADYPPRPWSSAREYLLLYTRFAGVPLDAVQAVWSGVKRAAPDRSLRVVGRGLSGEESRLARVEGVELLGWLDLPSRREAFATCRAGIVPWADVPTNRARSSVKVRELMAASIPVVANAVGELPELLEDVAEVIPVGETGRFIDAVLGLLDDPGRAMRLGQLARRRVELACDWSTLAGRVVRSYQMALDGGQS